MEMAQTEHMKKAICEAAKVNDIGEVSDGFHTFNSLYEQRMILFAALVKAYRDRAWKSYRHEDGEYCFGGGWFIVGINTPEGNYTYHYENKYWNMFDCVDLPKAPHWDGHTEKDAEIRLMSLEPKGKWVDKEIVYTSYTGIEKVQIMKCSECKRRLITPYRDHLTKYNFCPSCGTDMR